MRAILDPGKGEPPASLPGRGFTAHDVQRPRSSPCARKNPTGGTGGVPTKTLKRAAPRLGGCWGAGVGAACASNKFRLPTFQLFPGRDKYFGLLMQMPDLAVW